MIKQNIPISYHAMFIYKNRYLCIIYSVTYNENFKRKITLKQGWIPGFSSFTWFKIVCHMPWQQKIILDQESEKFMFSQHLDFRQHSPFVTNILENTFDHG